MIATLQQLQRDVDAFLIAHGLHREDVELHAQTGQSSQLQMIFHGPMVELVNLFWESKAEADLFEEFSEIPERDGYQLRYDTPLTAVLEPRI